MKPEYKVGAQWRVERENHPFTFVIVGPGSKPGYKQCRVEYDNESRGHRTFIQEYSHKHLKKYSVYQEKK